MRLSAPCLLRLAALLSMACTSGCPVRPPAAPAAALPAPAAHVGAAYTIAADESLLIIRVYRAGALASAGHNHIIASHSLSGTLYVAPEPLGSSFEVHVPLATLSVDEHDLRAQEPAADFPPDVPDTAKEGTRHNMLGPALLDAENYPQIVLSAVRLEELQPPRSGAALARVQALVRGTAHEFSVPVDYQRSASVVTVSGETSLRQSDLGLKPFSALLGALQVQDEMRISFRISAHPGAPAPPPQR
jgi:hypothetical protein